jgi:hypothetical protein
VVAGFGALFVRATSSSTRAPGLVAGGVTAQPAVPGLNSATFLRGHCYTWDQYAARTTVRDVPCAGPHLFEAVSDTAASAAADFPPGSPYPTREQWDSLTAQNCLQPAEDFLGYPLDPRGRFAADVIGPRADGWRAGERDLWCGITTFVPATTAAGGGLGTFTGEVRGMDQSLVYPAGTCLAQTATATTVVSCATPHNLLSVGGARMPDTAGGEAPDGSQFAQQASGLCLAAARADLGASYQPTATAQLSWYPIEPDSWQAGTRGFTCLIAYMDTHGNPRDLTSSPP